MADDDLSKLRIDKTQFLPHGRRRKGILFLVAALMVMIGAGYLYSQGILGSFVEVQIAPVTAIYPSQAYALLSASGYVVAQRKAAVGSKITSRLISLAVEEGDKVKEGEVIARLEDADVRAACHRAQANVEVAYANLAQAEAELKEARLAYQRHKELLARQLVSPSEFDAAEARYRSALAIVATQKAAIQASQAALEEAKVQLDYTLLRASFDAVVLTKDADVGDIITPLGAAANARAAVVTIADMDSLQVEADVSESNIHQVRRGQPGEIQLDALPDIRFRGKVHRIVPTADRSKASVLVKIAFIDKDPRILPEMSAKVTFLDREIAVDERTPVTAVPATAVIDQDGRSIVYAVRDGEAVATVVHLGRRLADMVEVVSGLTVGDRVVAQPQGKVRDGARIKAPEA